MKTSTFSLLLRLSLAWTALLSPVAFAVDYEPGQCTVRARNRVAYLAPGRNFELTGMPADGTVSSARVDCFVGGRWVRGGSDDFFLEQQDDLAVVEVSFDPPPILPRRLAVVVESDELAAGASTQLQLRVTYSDGSQVLLTSAASGVLWRSSNPRAASVDADGLLSAEAGGFVLVSGSFRGLVATAGVQVGEGAPDSDGDGIPDDVEVALFLNPNDPTDALLDFDGDTLDNLTEYQLGTNIYAFDTDGDGYSDGEEVAAGWDPLDADDPLGRVTELVVSPERLDILLSGGGFPRPTLEVTGLLPDGSSLDLTRHVDTTFDTSDVMVVVPDTPPNELRLIGLGEATVTVGFRELATEVPLTYAIYMPEPVTRLDLVGHANGVDFEGSLAVVAAGRAGLQVVDLSDEETPALGVRLPTAGNANDVLLRDDFALVADGLAGLLVVDLTSPTNPFVAAHLRDVGHARELARIGDVLAIAAGDAGLCLVDVSDPTAPSHLSRLAVRDESEQPLTAISVDLIADRAIVGTGRTGFAIVDIEDPSLPRQLELVAPFADAYADAVAFHDDWVVTGDASFASPFGDSLTVYERAELELLSTGGSHGWVIDLQGEQDRVVAASNGGLAWAHSESPFGGLVRLDDIDDDRDDFGTAVAARDGLALLTGCQGLRRSQVGLEGDCALYVIRHADWPLPVAVEPPRLVTPAADARVAAGSLLTLRAEMDEPGDLGVIEVHVDGEQVDVMRHAPFELRLRLPQLVPGVTRDLEIGLRRVHPKGSSSSIVWTRLELVGAAAPSVTLLAPGADVLAEPGETVTLRAEATAPAGLDRVELLVDGEVVSTSSSVPYEHELSFAGPGPVAIAARVVDLLGQARTSSSAFISRRPDPISHLELSLVSAMPPGGFRAGEWVRVDATGVGATPDSVTFHVDGALAKIDESPPFGVSLQLPSRATMVRVVAEGEGLGSTPLVLAVAADPGVVVTGRVEDTLGAPVAGTEVRVRGRLTSSDGDGEFRLDGVPAAPGPLQAESRLGSLRGLSEIGTVLGPTVNLGTVILREPDPAHRVIVGTNRAASWLEGPNQVATVSRSAQGSSAQMYGVAITPDGNSVITAQRYRRFGTLRTRSKVFAAPDWFEVDERHVAADSLHVSPDSAIVAAGREEFDSTALLLTGDLDTASTVAVVELPNTGLFLDDPGQTLLVAGEPDRLAAVAVAPTATGTDTGERVDLPAGDGPHALAGLPGGEHAVVTLGDAVALVSWSGGVLALEQVLELDERGVEHVALSHDGGTVFVSSDDAEVLVLSFDGASLADTGRRIPLVASVGEVAFRGGNRLAVSPDGTLLLAWHPMGFEARLSAIDLLSHQERADLRFQTSGLPRSLAVP
ncbi:MAG: Ig-like domain-containing protein [Acidobacteriota bacterium]